MFGISGIKFGQEHQVYNPVYSGVGSLGQARAELIRQGMSSRFADLLAAKYIRALEGPNSKVVRLMDLFDCKRDGFRANRALQEASLADVALNYQTLAGYHRQMSVDYLQHKSKQFFKGAADLQTNLGSLRPIRPLAQTASRGFSSQAEGSERKGFLNFLKVAEKTDSQVEQGKNKPTEASNELFSEQPEVEGLKDLEIGFDKAGTLESGLNLNEHFGTLDAATAMSQNELEEQRLISEAIATYDLDFFKQFSFSGKDSDTLAQKGLEEYITRLSSNSEVEKLLLSVIHQSYELNALIPNIEWMLYKIFFSPITTQEVRRSGNDRDNLLLGNLFAAKQMHLPLDFYRSLLQTLMIKEKKKHFKKLIAYIFEVEPASRVSPLLIDQIIRVGINNQYPITLGQVVRDMIIQHDYNIHRASFVKFLLFMERCKGFEEDAKKFYFLTAESSHLQINYELIRPMALRIIKNKTGPELMRFFEQLRKNLTLNKANSKLEPAERQVLIKSIRKQFYDGLIVDLMDNKCYELAEIVMAEKLKEKFPETVTDELLGLNIYSAQVKFDQYREKFNLFIDPESPYEFNEHISKELGKTLMKFNTDEFKNDRLQLTEKLTKKMRRAQIPFDGELFHNIVFVYCESQQWSDVAQILRDMHSVRQCQPQQKTVKYLRQNLIYCFQNSIRLDVLDAID